MGLILLFLSWFVPFILVVSKQPIRMEAVFGLAAMGGAFSERLFTWIENLAKKIWPKS
jgi:hypothetical protein